VIQPLHNHKFLTDYPKQAKQTQQLPVHQQKKKELKKSKTNKRSASVSRLMAYLKKPPMPKVNG
jgi:hypothetical protein